MDKQKQLYKEQHKDDPSDGSDMAAFNGGLKGMMAGVVGAFIYNSYRPSDFLIEYIDQYFEVFIVACAVLGYIIGHVAGKFFYTEN